MLSLLFYFLYLYFNNFFKIEKLFTFSGNFQKKEFIVNCTQEKAEKPVLESFSLFYSSIKQIILFLLPFQ